MIILSINLLPRMNDMFDFFRMGSVELQGTRNNGIRSPNPMLTKPWAHPYYNDEWLRKIVLKFRVILHVLNTFPNIYKYLAKIY